MEDSQLRDYLLGMEIPAEHSVWGRGKALTLNAADALPDWFQSLLQTDSVVRDLWEGRGKAENTDSSRSGYDFSLSRKLFQLGHRDVDQHGTVLSLRPNGAAADRAPDYLVRTVSAALESLVKTA